MYLVSKLAVQMRAPSVDNLRLRSGEQDQVKLASRASSHGRGLFKAITDVHVYDCARNESGPSVVYSSGEDVKSEEGARRGPRDPEPGVGSRG